MSSDLLSQLPLFATDQQLAVAIVGRDRATMWVKTVIPQLERKGFPRIDPLHDGRPVPLVRKFYDGYLGLTAGFAAAAPDGKENLDVWLKIRREKQKPRLGLSGNHEKVIRFMVDNTDCTTPDVIPNAGEYTMEQLTKLGALKETGINFQGARQWVVTDEGRREIKRIDDWRNGKFVRSPRY
ncbi:hypothetical protein QN219_04940 [Sinorhizobium sp. 7-81]|uniref:hypothetical protein n=1 Tax=Sinorhizobium sp. 8-89 TaxID=3049089 RepID=UPI0024C3E29E|nr:hypothetical protein [Sinorhizobium sp. 8-89]MDK1489402.1 hypothetical protein [Sinorhizobium sp. 8-89]